MASTLRGRQQNAQRIAYDWHGGQWSPLYSFASTGGIVHSAEHQAGILREIDSIPEAAKDAELAALRAYIASVIPPAS
ncbi:MAG: hypothetical protein NUW01_08220 [Gemmatimonadaceae bacterium]|nr:hypothetical protein [Gemmatimonadaceae bacterium]